jgi:hypothetical protein
METSNHNVKEQNDRTDDIEELQVLKIPHSGAAGVGP